MAVQTWGVDQAHMESYFSHIDVDTDSPITAARLAEIVEGAAAEVNAAIHMGYGAGVVDTIAQDTATDAYRNCQRCTVILAAPEYFRAAFGQIDSGTMDAAEEKAERLRDRLARRPTLQIGYVASQPPQVETSTQALGLSTSSASANEARRYFDGRRNGQNEGGWQY